jgi:hypothetical protein
MNVSLTDTELKPGSEKNNVLPYISMAVQALVKQNRWIRYNGFEVCQQIFSDFYDGWLRNMSPLFLSLILVEGPDPKNGVMHGSRLYPWDNL